MKATAQERKIASIIEPAISGVIKHTEAALIKGVTEADAA